MDVERFVHRCPALWHVAPAGAWEGIQEHGLRTAEQLIGAADLADDVRAELLTTPRPDAVELVVGGRTVVLRDQEPLLRIKDLPSRLGEGLTVADWVQVLNQRAYLFADQAALQKLLAKYVERWGAQEVLSFSSRRLHAATGRDLQLSDQNTGAVARRTDAYKTRDTFRSVTRFPDVKPKEVTILDGLDVDQLEVVTRVVRHEADGTTTKLA